MLNATGREAAKLCHVRLVRVKVVASGPTDMLSHHGSMCSFPGVIASGTLVMGAREKKRGLQAVSALLSDCDSRSGHLETPFFIASGSLDQVLVIKDDHAGLRLL